MKAEVIIDQETQKVKLILDWKSGIVGPNLTVDDAENVVKLIEEASRKASCEAFRQWLMQFECREDVIVLDGKTYRFKMVSEKKFLTKFGVITVSRRIFQQDDLDLYAVLTIMQAVFRPDIAERILKIYQKIKPKLDDPHYRDRWLKIMRYAMASSKYFWV